MSTDAQPAPSIDVSQLPTDVATCHQLIQELCATLNEMHRRNQQLEHRVEQLCRHQYGPRSERDPNQPRLFEEPADASSQASAEQNGDGSTINVPAHRRQRRPGRNPIPDHLPRHRLDHDLDESDRACPCCGEQRRRIGEEVSEQLDYIPASLFVWQHVRAKYACKACEGHVVLADKPRQPIEKSIAGPGLIAHVIVSKYCDHQPLNRQNKILKRNDVDIARSTQCGWCADSAKLIAPIHERMGELIRESHCVQTDDTPNPVLDPGSGRGKTKTGRFWVYRGDHRYPYTVFDYTPDRSRDGPTRWLKHYSGYLQADAYSVYDQLFIEGTEAGVLIEVACWMHGRRYFYNARDSAPGLAQIAMAWIGQLYEIEKRAKDLEPAERKALRKREAKPILRTFGKWLKQQRDQVLPKDPIGKGVHYVLSNWRAMNRYIYDGELSIDNGASERDIRPIKVGANNWLFSGSDAGGRTAAIHFSIVRTCERHGIDPFAYYRDVLTRLPDHPISRIDELLPDRWQPQSEPTS